ncbi:thiamine-phosphate kinase [bacterium]|nr:thiamine-phosphate kinase [bacterium]
MNTVSDLGEFGLLKELHKILNPTHPDILVGLGDDAAVVLPPKTPIVMTTDAMVEGVHFKREWTTAQNIAQKALGSALSDLAGKCAKPAYAMITFGLPGETPLDWVYGFYQRLAELQQEWGVAVIGGDTVQSPQIWISISVYGTQTSPQPITISSAKPGDAILVSGSLGDAAAGLETLLNPQPDACDLDMISYLQNRLHCPVPRLNEAMAIASIAIPNAMTDVSDGLARDLAKICAASGVGARLDGALLPCSDALIKYANENAPDYAWRGGEEYELLLTLPQDQAASLLEQWSDSKCSLHQIGEITQSTEIIVDGVNRQLSGFDHFKSKSTKANLD